MVVVVVVAIVVELKKFLYILNILLLSNIYNLQIFSYPVDYLFTLLIVSSDAHTLILM